ncbi:MAG: hypothetical protein RL318_2448 [Fibrobacterota bacterium]|jgi:TonB family protein
MKHFHIELERNGKLTRTWELWSENLKVGSALGNDIVLPPPYAAVVAECETAPYGMEVALGEEKLRIIEDTDIQRVRWASARERMELARRLGWHEPGQGRDNTRKMAFGLMGILGIVAMVGMVMVGRSPKAEEPTNIQSVIELVAQVDEKKPEDVEPPKPDPVVEPSGASDQKPTSKEEGGPTEVRTVAWPPKNASSVMANSVLDKINTQSEGMIGEAVDASSENVIDAILAGGGGKLTRGDRGGRGASGDGDRRDAVGGVGFGTGGRAGWGPNSGGARKGVLTMGRSGTGDKIATRSKQIEARPSDVELGGEAGSRSPESILRVIRAHVGGFRFSYEKYLKQNPDVGGKISLKFTIAPSGDIVSISVAGSSTGVPALDDDIKEKARRMKFDTIEKGNVTVTYAFVLDRQ